MLTMVLLACGGIRAASEDATRAETDIKNELGVGSNVSFRVLSTAKGETLSVAVTLKGAPPGDLATLRARVSAIVTRDFRAHVDQLSVAF